jgi:hypothetical protein
MKKPVMKSSNADMTLGKMQKMPSVSANKMAKKMALTKSKGKPGMK